MSLLREPLVHFFAIGEVLSSRDNVSPPSFKEEGKE
jgi:hypothetical protein